VDVGFPSIYMLNIISRLIRKPLSIFIQLNLCLSGTVQSVDGVYVSAEFGGQIFTLHQMSLKKV
jgi:hypothetical protein